MFDGKMLRGETGTPIRMIDLANSSFADAEPEPLTLANLTTKSLTAWIGFMVAPSYAARRIPPPSLLWPWWSRQSEPARRCRG
jgi:hypothetical protein